MKIPTYNHDLGDGLFVKALAIDSATSSSDLEEMFRRQDGTSKFDIEALSKDLVIVGRISSLSELTIEVSPEPYQVPQALRAYKESGGNDWYGQGKKNNPIAVVEGPLQTKMRFRRGEYFDFLATKLEVVPAELASDAYPAGKTVEQIMQEAGIRNEDRARYLAFAFSIQTNNGKETNLVQRAKSLGIAADCIALSGSTPPFDERFFETGFNFPGFFEEHIAKEIGEEYGLIKRDFSMGGAYLIDDEKSIPHAVIKILTPMDIEELAERSSISKDGPREHPVLYNMPVEAIRRFLDRFKVWPSSSFFMHNFYEDEMQKRDQRNQARHGIVGDWPE